MARITTIRHTIGGTALALLALAGCSPVSVSAPPAPAGTTAPASAPPVAGATSAGAVSGASEPDKSPLPAGLLLPDEGQPSGSPDFTDWETDTSPGQTWLLDPCVPTTYPTDAQRTSFRTVSQTGPEAHSARQLAVYPSEEVATEVLAGFRRALTACSTGTTAAGDRWTWVSADAPDLGDDGLVAASTIGSPPSSPVGDRIAVTRVGSAVFLAYEGGEFSTAELDGGVDHAQEVAQRFLDSL
jgi:hypothetical protein